MCWVCLSFMINIGLNTKLWCAHNKVVMLSIAQVLLSFIGTWFSATQILLISGCFQILCWKLESWSYVGNNAIGHLAKHVCRLQILSIPTFFNNYIEFLERNSVHTNWRIYVNQMGSLTILPHFSVFGFYVIWYITQSLSIPGTRG